ncbi:hypothetical protein K456DRAFT_29042 [Colletotrichum gloeosporioides 23]|nr:hypothetical protein K456DRAFT_29042 [Colletotrichum gloeosporioides 23]
MRSVAPQTPDSHPSSGHEFVYGEKTKQAAAAGCPSSSVCLSYTAIHPAAAESCGPLAPLVPTDFDLPWSPPQLVQRRCRCPFVLVERLTRTTSNPTCSRQRGKHESRRFWPGCKPSNDTTQTTSEQSYEKQRVCFLSSGSPLSVFLACIDHRAISAGLRRHQRSNSSAQRSTRLVNRRRAPFAEGQDTQAASHLRYNGQRRKSTHLMEAPTRPTTKIHEDICMCVCVCAAQRFNPVVGQSSLSHPTSLGSVNERLPEQTDPPVHAKTDGSPLLPRQTGAFVLDLSRPSAFPPVASLDWSCRPLFTGSAQQIPPGRPDFQTQM